MTCFISQTNPGMLSSSRCEGVPMSLHSLSILEVAFQQECCFCAIIEQLILYDIMLYYMFFLLYHVILYCIIVFPN